jgi:hypothetical protein
MELVADGSLCCANGTRGAGDDAVTYSTSFSIQNARILCDVVTPDPSVQDELSRVLLAGGSLPMHFTSYNTVINNTNTNPPALNVAANTPLTTNWSITISRAYSRIKDIWITFRSDDALAVNTHLTEANCFLNWHGKDGAADYQTIGDAITYSPANGEKWRFQMTTGSLVFPDLPMTSSQEAWYQLSKTLGMHSSLDGASIGSEWLGFNFIIALDMEKMNSSPGAGNSSFTGLSTRNAGDTLRFAFDAVTPKIHTGDYAPGNGAPVVRNAVLSRVAWPTHMYTTIHMDLVLELRAEGCLLLD